MSAENYIQRHCLARQPLRCNRAGLEDFLSRMGSIIPSITYIVKKNGISEDAMRISKDSEQHKDIQCRIAWEQEGQYLSMLGAIESLALLLRIVKAKNQIRRKVGDKSPPTSGQFALCRMEETKLAVGLLASNLGRVLNAKFVVISRCGLIKLSETYEVDGMTTSEVDIPDSVQSDEQRR
ncbi:hypothetical protein ARMSODRAFT_979424 [Armillaria solidipes]|uniref:Uncharacterized protein n=1 Tax=Armillaria solidipes TaxID=1076256 RepID=A0A2H3BLV7_9AGAR|nr:hypothetical protein ARMSODRAFT_979424 [Armillaria solidipes]